MEKQNTNPPKPIKPKQSNPKFNVSWIYGIIILALFSLYFISDGVPSKEIPFSRFKEYVKQGMIDKVNVYTTSNTLEAFVLDYNKLSKDTALIYKHLGHSAEAYIGNKQALKDSLAKKDLMVLKKIF